MEPRIDVVTALMGLAWLAIAGMLAWGALDALLRSFTWRPAPRRTFPMKEARP